jgi:hypothetical protein
MNMNLEEKQNKKLEKKSQKLTNRTYTGNFTK